jgi:6-pyruvoyltetrahydropterin/6-carboxytetrahydropterin synthase
MKYKYQSTKVIELGSTAFRQWRATHSHCSKLHGYQLKAKIWFTGTSLDDKNWMVDFGGLKQLKSKLQDIFDHTTTIAADDPELELFKELDKRGVIDLRIFENGVGIERVAEKVFEVSNEYIRNLTMNRCWVDRVEAFEHQDNSATVTREDIERIDTCCGGVATEYKYEPVQAHEQEPVHEPVQEEVQQPFQGPVTYIHRPGVSEGMSNPFAGTKWGM